MTLSTKKSAPPAGSADKAKFRFGQENCVSSISIQLLALSPFERQSAIMTLGANQNAPYKIAATVFGYSGFTLTQLKRAGNVAIYKQTKGKQSPAFEVVIIRRTEAWTAFGKEFPGSEYYPVNKDWGTYGFTFSAIKDAERKFVELTACESGSRSRPNERRRYRRRGGSDAVDERARGRA
jgi:hypothetical protein